MSDKIINSGMCIKVEWILRVGVTKHSSVSHPQRKTLTCHNARIVGGLEL